jgi:5-(carboxyamino)imidazole ribonucleotide synthase
VKVAILGGGQLARMLAMSAHRIGMEPWVVDPAPDAPAAPVARHVVADLDDPRAWRAVSHCHVATAELDHAPLRALAWLEKRMPVRPSPRAFATAGDRLLEKRLFRKLGIETPRFLPVDSDEALLRALPEIGLPAVLKCRREGYDGKGQQRIQRPEQALPAWRRLGGRPAVLEAQVPFSREVSFLAVRGSDGEVRFWNPVENHHRDGILRWSRPLRRGESVWLERAGERAVRLLLETLGYVGVLAVEFFEVGERLLANEIACRVHNSGHWTQEGAETGQFENHLRALAGWPLGGTALLGPTALVNLIGDAPSPSHWLGVPEGHLHLYGKSPAPGRKLGHVTLRARSDAELDAALSGALLSRAGEAAPPLRALPA